MTYIMALLTSLMGIAPSFSPWRGSAKSANTSWISASCAAEMLFSLASLERFSRDEVEAEAEDIWLAVRFGGCGKYGREIGRELVRWKVQGNCGC